MVSRNVALNNEPAGPINPAFHGNAALIDSETYQTKNLNLNTETHRIVNPEPEHLGRTCCVSGYEPITPIVCGGGLASLASSKAASGVVVNNETLHA